MQISDDMTIPFAIKLAEQDETIARLRETLRPFAEIKLPDCVPDDALVIMTDISGGIIVDPSQKIIRAGDLRRARAALEPRG